MTVRDDDGDVDCLSTEIHIRQELMDLHERLAALGLEVIAVTVGGAPNFEVNIFHAER